VRPTTKAENEPGGCILDPFERCECWHRETDYRTGCNSRCEIWQKTWLTRSWFHGWRSCGFDVVVYWCQTSWWKIRRV